MVTDVIFLSYFRVSSLLSGVPCIQPSLHLHPAILTLASSHPYTCPVSEIKGKLYLFPFRNENPRDKWCKILYATHKEISEPYVKTIPKGLP